MRQVNYEIQLLKELVKRPSYDDGKFFESAMTDYLKEVFKKELPEFKCQELVVSKNRSNLLFANSADPKLLVIDHMDTVRPSNAWKNDPLVPFMKDNRIFGLGSSDTKGNIAALIGALRSLDLKKLSLAILFYVDEEYSFAGMKKYAKSSLARSLKPEYMMSIDGSGLKLGLGCRGVIECKFIFRGESGHSANPASGTNAVKASLQMFGQLEKWLASFGSTDLGPSTLNIAQIKGGTQLSDGEFSNAGNIIANYCEVLFEIRVASTKLNANLAKSFIRKREKVLGVSLEKFEVKLDLGCFINSRRGLKNVTNIIDRTLGATKFLNLATFGYLDQQMLVEVYPKAKFFSFGCGEEGQAHKADEFNTVTNIMKAKEIYKNLLEELAQN